MNACITSFYCSLQLLGRRRLIDIKNAGYNTKLSAPLDNVPFSTRIERDRIEDSVRTITYNQCRKSYVYLVLVSYFSLLYEFRFYIVCSVDFQSNLSYCCSQQIINRCSEISWTSLPLQRSHHLSLLPQFQR